MESTDPTALPFSGQVCVITGAGSGIGRALALALAARGAKLAISDINAEAVAQTAQDAQVLAVATGAEIEPYILDVSDRDQFFAHAEAVQQRFGPANLVINNAGVAVSSEIKDLSFEDFEWIMGINFWGVVNGTKAFLPQLISSGDGTLVNISSVFGLISVPTQGSYNSAKFAVRGFTEALRQEMLIDGSPVKICCVHPGGVKTNIARSSRINGSQFGDRQQVADNFDRLALTTPEKAATIILTGAAKGRPRILVGPDAHAIEFVSRLTGAGYQKLVYRMTRAMQAYAGRSARR